MISVSNPSGKIIEVSHSNYSITFSKKTYLITIGIPQTSGNEVGTILWPDGGQILWPDGSKMSWPA